MTNFGLKINYRYLPGKLHYLLFLSGLSGVLPYLPVFAKNLGISAALVGFIYTVLPFLQFFSKPFISGLADKTQKHKFVLLTALVITIVCIGSIYFIPEIHNNSQESPTAAEFFCNPIRNQFVVCNDNNFKNLFEKNESLIECKSTCLLSLAEHSPLCEDWNITDCNSNDNISESISTTLVKMSATLGYEEAKDCAVLPIFSASLLHPLANSYPLCHQNVTLGCDLQCYSNVSESTTSTAIYTTYQFWWLCSMMIISWISIGSIVCIADSLVYDVLGENRHLFGHQRLWGTIGWGGIIVVAGFFNDLASAKAGKPDFSPGFYLFIAFIFMDLVVLSRLKVQPRASPPSITSNIGKLLKKPRILVFIWAVFCIGFLTGILESFHFWYLTDLGSTNLLLGLSRSVQCFLAELPAFIVSGWVIKRIGHVNALSLTIGTYGLRFFCYSFLVNPWWTLPIELCHSVTFGIFYSAMTSYASIVAPSGMSTTLQGLMGGVYEGAGMAIGSLVGGFVYHVRGGRFAFRSFGLLGFGACIFHIVAQYLVARFTKRPEQLEVNVEEMEGRELQVLPRIFSDDKKDDEQDGMLNNKQGEHEDLQNTEADNLLSNNLHSQENSKSEKQ